MLKLVRSSLEKCSSRERVIADKDKRNLEGLKKRRVLVVFRIQPNPILDPKEDIEYDMGQMTMPILFNTSSIFGVYIQVTSGY